jgi:hypothetical protein
MNIETVSEKQHVSAKFNDCLSLTGLNGVRDRIDVSRLEMGCSSRGRPTCLSMTPMIDTVIINLF